MSYQILQGNCIDTLKTLAPESVQCVVTSPPYFGLRDYGTARWMGGTDPECDHTYQKGGRNPEASTKQISNNGTQYSQYEKVCKRCGALRVDDQIGLEETPEMYVEKLVQVFREVRRVLSSDGILWLNLGDSYWGGKGASGYELPHEAEARRAKGETFQTAHNVPGYTNMRPTDGKHPIIKPKDLIGIPWAVAFALRADGWYLRSEIIWHKKNPMPESVTDRPTKSHEQIFLLSKSAQYYYDAEAIAEPSIHTDDPRMGFGRLHYRGKREGQTGTGQENFVSINETRNKRDVWTVSTKPYAEAHFATFPPDLIEPCILAGTSEMGECPECHKPWVRVTHRESNPRRSEGRFKSDYRANVNNHRPQGSGSGSGALTPTIYTLGWQPQCNHGHDPIPQTVLDPFAGSGTTLSVAIKHRRNAIGCELNPKYIKLIERRLNKTQIAMPLMFESNV